MEDIYETKLIWHSSRVDPPKKHGEYLCKVVDVERIYRDKVIWGETYYFVYEFYDGLWQCDGVVIAWAEIPECSFELE